VRENGGELTFGGEAKHQKSSLEKSPHSTPWDLAVHRDVGSPQGLGAARG